MNQITRNALKIIRQTLAELNTGDASHQAAIAPDPAVIFAPASHANALDPERPLVIGNRGVGKSFWSAVLVHSQARLQISQIYNRLKLQRVEAVLGFHEDAGKDEGPAPSPAVLKQLLGATEQPEDIWRAVLLKALGARFQLHLPSSLRDLVEWTAENVENSEEILRKADRDLQESGTIFLLVFDALDRLGRDWNTISLLSEGLLRFALEVRGFKAIRTKIFMRTDQANDDDLFRFADASKIKADAVRLEWQRTELFGLLYKQLLSDEHSAGALAQIAPHFGRLDVLRDLLEDEVIQEKLFYTIAGEFMGASAKRGRTYSWLFDHLADAFGETSPRSFLTALQRAASHGPPPSDTAIDHNGIRSGVQVASEIRVAQLKEDYDWITEVLQALEGLEVPCDPAVFKGRWKERTTVERIEAQATAANKLLPLELERRKSDPEGSLLTALSNIGVVEFRTEARINMPDIFRVAAGIKRRGGIRPPDVNRRR